MDIFDFHIHVQNTTDPTEITDFLNQIGAKKGAILGTDHGNWGKAHGTQLSNQDVARIVASVPDRLVGIASVHPDSPCPVEDLEKAACLGLRGLKLYPHSGFYPNTDRLYDVYALAQQLDLPVLIHTGIKAHTGQMMKYNRPLYIDEIAVDFPRLKIIIMHAGYPWVKEALILSKLNDNVWIDLTFLDVLEDTFEDDLLQNTITACMRTVGADKLVWGSEGWSLGLPRFRDEGILRVQKCIRKIQNISFLSDAEKEKILYRNAASLILE